MRKWWFKRQCRKQGIPASSAELIWNAFGPYEQASWFRQHYGKTLLKADKNQLLLTMIPLDYLNHDGMALIFTQLERYLPTQGVRLHLAQFCRYFYDSILKPHGEKCGDDWKVFYDVGHYQVMRKLFIKNLVAFVVRETRLPHMETELMARFSSYYNAAYPQT